MYIDEIELDRIYSDYEYPEVVFKKDNYVYCKFIPVILEEIKDENGIIYNWQYIRLPMYEYSYGKLVEKIIELKYSNSEVIARLNNYISEPNDSKYKTEYEELIDWRKTAKNFAKKHFNLV